MITDMALTLNGVSFALDIIRGHFAADPAAAVRGLIGDVELCVRRIGGEGGRKDEESND